MAEQEWDWQTWADQGPAYGRVWGFLTLDIQNDPGAAIALLAQVERLLANPNQPGFQRSGNAYHLQCDGGGVTLSTLVVEEPDQHLPLAPFRAALVAWLHDLGTHP